MLPLRVTARRNRPFLQPGVPKIDWSNPLTQGLVSAYVPGTGWYGDLVGNGPVLAKNSAVAIGVTGRGQGDETLLGTNNGGAKAQVGAALQLSAASIAWYGFIDGLASGNNERFFSVETNNSNSSPFVSYGLGNGNSVGTGPTLYFNNAGTFGNVTNGANITSFHYLGGDVASGLQRLFVDTNLVASATNAGAPSYTATATLCMGCNTTGGGVSNGLTLVGFIWNRVRSPQEHEALALDPFQFLLFEEDAVASLQFSVPPRSTGPWRLPLGGQRIAPPWQRPAGQSKLNWEAAPRGLVFAVDLANPDFTELTGAHWSKPILSGSPVQQTCAYGVGLKTAGGAECVAYALGTQPTRLWSLEALIYVSNPTVDGTICGYNQSSDGSSGTFDRTIEGLSGNWLGYLFDGGAKTATGPVDSTKGRLHFVATTDGSSLNFYYNGVLQNTTAVANGGYQGYTPPEYLCIGRASNSVSFGSSTVLLVNFANACWTPQEVQERYQEPYGHLSFFGDSAANVLGTGLVSTLTGPWRFPVGDQRKARGNFKGVGQPILNPLKTPRGLVVSAPLANGFAQALGPGVGPPIFGASPQFKLSPYGPGWSTKTSTSTIVSYQLPLYQPNVLSFEVLLYIVSATNDGSICGLNGAANGSGPCSLWFSSFFPNWEFNVFDTGPHSTGSSVGTPGPGSLYHLVGTNDGAGNIKIYINGVLAATNTGIGTLFNTYTSLFLLVGTNNSSSNGWNEGIVLLCNLANVAWTPQEVWARYKDPFGHLLYPSDWVGDKLGLITGPFDMSSRIAMMNP